MEERKEIFRRIKKSKDMFDAYNPDVWVKKKFYDLTGGYVVIHKNRMANSYKSKNEGEKFALELSMSEVFAQNGARIEMLDEDPHRRSYDVNIDGYKADLKCVTSIKRTVGDATNAIKMQHADIVLLKFQRYSSRIHGEIKSLVSMGVHGKYFIGDEKEIHDF